MSSSTTSSDCPGQSTMETVEDVTNERGGEAAASKQQNDRKFKPQSSKAQQLNMADAIEIFQLRPKAADGKAHRRGSLLLCKSVAPKYGVSPKTIRDIWRCRTWSHATQHLWSTQEKQLHSDHIKQKFQRKKTIKALKSTESKEPGESYELNFSPSPPLLAISRTSWHQQLSNEATINMCPNFPPPPPTALPFLPSLNMGSVARCNSHSYAAPQRTMQQPSYPAPFLFNHSLLSSGAFNDPLPMSFPAIYSPMPPPLLALQSLLSCIAAAAGNSAAVAHNGQGGLRPGHDPSARPAISDAFWRAGA
jgi:hypothetical protein